MKPRNETSMHSAFDVQTVVGFFHLRLPQYDGAEETKAVSVCYDFWQMLYLDHGHYVCRLGERIFSLSPGQLLFCEPGTIRTSVRHEKAVVGIISFRCSSMKMDRFRSGIFSLSEEERQKLSQLLSTGREVFTDIPEEASIYGQQPKEGTADYELQSIKNQLELLLIELYKNRRPTQAAATFPQNQFHYSQLQFRRIEEFLLCSLGKNLTVDQISRHTGFSVTTIKRICSRHVGCGAIHYFLTLKILEAKRMIRETDMSLTQIAEVLGFSSIYYFSRVFKSRTGVSPKQYAASVLRT